MSEGRPLLYTEDLRKDFSGLVAVDGVSWDVNWGETVGILGPNGAGKSTFFNLLAGVIDPTGGRIYFDGEDITDHSAHETARKGIVKTFQTTNLFSDLTVLENIRIAAQATETTFDMFSRVEDLDGVEADASDVVKRFGLEPIREDLVGELSHGDQRRVEIAVAVATDPKIILIDEPTSGIANEEIDELTTVFEDLKDDGSYTLVLIEHNVDVLLDLTESITVLHEGTVLAENPPEQIVENDDVQRIYMS
jgi:branched-chain amino acid transport system ATP-binding protein